MEHGAQIGGTGLTRPIKDAAVEAAFERFDPQARASLLALRDLIFHVAQDMPEVGPLLETLKWGQPAYLPAKPKIGTTIRLGVPKSGGFALYTHCQTPLMSDLSAQFGAELRFEGNRGVLFEYGAAVPHEPLRILIARALTYHLKT